jgi:hypothetical protein
MDHLFIKFLLHIRNEETKETIEMLKANPYLIAFKDDEMRLSPLHHALFNKAPFFIISTFVDYWLLLEDFQSLSDMQLVHLACIHNVPYNVIHYLSSLFHGSLTLKHNKGYTPFMHALEKKLDEDFIQLLSYSNVKAIGDFDQGNYQKAKYKMIEEQFGDESLIDSKMAMFWLEHKDPTLNHLVMGDRFNCIHPTASDGLFLSSQYK